MAPGRWSQSVYTATFARSVRDGLSVAQARQRARDAVTAATGWQPKRHRYASDEHSGGGKAPAEVLAEAERLRDLSPSSLTGYLMGDPLPGRSALDKSQRLG